MYPFREGGSGIYTITNSANGKQYVGSAVDLRRRSRAHIASLNRGAHDNSYLQRSWDKYGGASFGFVVLEFVEDVEDLIPREQHYIDTLNPEYNLRPMADSQLGWVPSEETRRKISQSNMGKKASLETRKRQSEARKGKRLSEEHCRKISESKLGEKHHYYGKELSADHRRRIGEAQVGRKHKPESIEKVRQAKMGKKRPQWVKDKLSLARRGEGASKAKLTEGDVREIRFLLAQGELSQRAISDIYGVDPSAISDIKRRVTWSHVYV